VKRKKSLIRSGKMYLHCLYLDFGIFFFGGGTAGLISLVIFTNPKATKKKRKEKKLKN
jgi:hypothetical protein